VGPTAVMPSRKPESGRSRRRPHDAGWDAVGLRGADLLKRYLRLGGEGQRPRHPGPAASGRLLGAGLRQIETLGHRQARMLVGDRDADRDLTNVRLAALTAVLPRDADRVRALFREVGIVGDPGLDRACCCIAGSTRAWTKANIVASGELALAMR